MTEQDRPVVYMVEDDQQVQELVSLLLKEVAVSVHCYGTAEEMLREFRPEQHACLLIDVRLPGMSGTELMRALAQQEIPPAVIVLTGHADVPLTVEVMKLGAIDLLEKPFHAQKLLDAIHRALTVHAEALRQWQQQQDLREQLQRLTPREREVLRELVSGKAHKKIAADLGISRKTLDVHRANLMRKLQAESVVELVRLCLAGCAME